MATTRKRFASRIAKSGFPKTEAARELARRLAQAQLSKRAALRSADKPKDKPRPKGVIKVKRERPSLATTERQVLSRVVADEKESLYAIAYAARGKYHDPVPRLVARGGNGRYLAVKGTVSYSQILTPGEYLIVFTPKSEHPGVIYRRTPNDGLSWASVWSSGAKTPTDNVSQKALLSYIPWSGSVSPGAILGNGGSVTRQFMGGAYTLKIGTSINGMASIRALIPYNSDVYCPGVGDETWRIAAGSGGVHAPDKEEYFSSTVHQNAKVADNHCCTFLGASRDWFSVLNTSGAATLLGLKEYEAHFRPYVFPEISTYRRVANYGTTATEQPIAVGHIGSLAIMPATASGIPDVPNFELGFVPHGNAIYDIAQGGGAFHVVVGDAGASLNVNGWSSFNTLIPNHSDDTALADMGIPITDFNVDYKVLHGSNSLGSTQTPVRVARGDTAISNSKTVVAPSRANTTATTRGGAFPALAGALGLGAAYAVGSSLVTSVGNTLAQFPAEGYGLMPEELATAITETTPLLIGI